MAHDEESCLVGGSLYTALRLSRFHGVAALDFIPVGNYYVARISNSGVLYSWILFTCLTVTGFVGIIIDLQSYGTSDSVGFSNVSYALIWISEIAMTKTIIVFGLYNGRTRMKNLLRYLKQIEKVNRDMRCDLTQQFHDKMLSAGVIGILVTSYISLLINFGLYSYSTIEKTIVLMIYGLYPIENSMALLLLMQVACFVVRLRSAFKQINNRLGELRDIQTLNTRRSLRDISKSYVRLCSVVRDFNKENGFMMFLIFAAPTTYLFIASYHLLLTLCSPDLGTIVNRLHTTISLAVAIVMYFTKIFLLVEPCHRTHEEMEKTNVVLNKVTYHLTPIGCPVAVELDILHMQVILCKTTFSPLSIYILHRSLIATVMSALVGFIVFVKQYHIIQEC